MRDPAEKFDSTVTTFPPKIATVEDIQRMMDMLKDELDTVRRMWKENKMSQLRFLMSLEGKARQAAESHNPALMKSELISIADALRGLVVDLENS